MSDLVARLRARAHLTEFRICGEAAAALERAERERDEANRRYQELCARWLQDQQTPDNKRPPASNRPVTMPASRSAGDRDDPGGRAFP